jgi:DNA-directed RNA polymerase specialized sigma24 family protein
MAGISFAKVDFEEVLGKLTLYAQSLTTAMVCFGLDEKVLAGGDSAVDLAHSTLVKLIDPLDNTVQWSPARGEPTTSGVLAYLKKILQRDFFDLKKSSLFKTSVYANPGEDEDSANGDKGCTLDEMAVTFETPEGLALQRERVRWILKQFEGEPELKEIAELLFSPEGYTALSNQELANILSTPVRDIENRKKRVKLRLRNLAATMSPEKAKNV